jgi:hypothetical protein
MSSFKTWTREKLRKRFGLERTYDHPLLLEWLNISSSVALQQFEIDTLMRLRAKMLRYVDYWNEEEVKLKFIGHVITLTDYDTDSISAFADRHLEGTVDGELLSGEPDLMVAQGKQEVSAPFFFLHEYKKELDNDSPDPAGQCLAAMLVAQELNLDTPPMTNLPIYGAYVVGRYWYFVVLKGKEYSITDGFMATHEDDLLSILRMLKVTRQKMREIWGE